VRWSVGDGGRKEREREREKEKERGGMNEKWILNVGKS